MVDNSRRRQAKVSLNLPIEGMESVVATVTGYEGTDRFNLIKLISKAGANYVGSMNQSITHLVCWKYEGRKYQLARKLKITIVNHQWVEDCIKKGRRLPEYPYTFQCGFEVGSLLLDISLIADKSQLELNKSRRKRKTNKGSPRPGKSFGSTYGFEEPLSPQFLRLEKKRDSASVQSSCKSRKRRLVKKEMREILELDSDSEQKSHPLSDFQEHASTAYFSNHSDVEGQGGLYNSTCGENRSSRTEVLNDLTENVDVDDVLECEEKSPYLKGATTSHVKDDINVNNIAGAARLPGSIELSCVICWTDFSASRGVLPCGHRFCCPCIRSWADHMNSSGKISTCPLCKTIFEEIIEVEDAVSFDQKIYTQTIPDDDVRMVHIVPGVQTLSIRSNLQEPPVCSQCNCREPEDLLISCHICQRYCIHSFCLDPPIDPWTCVHCRGLRMLLSN